MLLVKGEEALILMGWLLARVVIWPGPQFSVLLVVLNTPAVVLIASIRARLGKLPFKAW